jgi:GDPmannose 4,6-dehydratase
MLWPRARVKEVFTYLNLDWQKYVEIDARYFRPTEVEYLEGDASKARKVLKWRPKVTFGELVKMMTDADMIIAEREKIVKEYEEAK